MSGFCDISCGRCIAAPAAAACSDVAPNNQYTCAQQVGAGYHNVLVDFVTMSIGSQIKELETPR